MPISPLLSLDAAVSLSGVIFFIFVAEMYRGVHSSLRLNMNTGLWSIAPLFIVPCISLSAHLMSNFERLVPDFLFSSALSLLLQTLLPCKFPWRCDYFFGFRDYFVSNHTDRQAYSISTDKKISKMNTGSAVQAQDCLCYSGDVIKWYTLTWHHSKWRQDSIDIP